MNVLVFALMDDDTDAVLTSMWTDYPVIQIVLFMTLVFFFFQYVIRKLQNFNLKKFEPSTSVTSFLIVGSVVLYFTGLRSTWATFPFRMQNTIISENSFINKIGIGGAYALQNAFKERAAQTINTDIKSTLKKYNFKSIAEPLEALLDRKVTGNPDISSLIKTKTPIQPHLESSKPNVVVVQMESFSSAFLEFHSPDFNLLGSLEDELKKAYVFKNFVSASSTTVHSLEAILVASPETPLSQSTYRQHSLSSACTLPFLAAGYKTSFVTGAELAWRNLGEYLFTNHFQEVEGNVTLKKIFADAQDGEWGTYDEFVFNQVLQKLKNTSTPQFIYVMTTTNHTPYDMPAGYRPLPLNMPEELEQLLKPDKEIALRNFLTFQYVNDCLGKFIKSVRASPFGKHTIIAAVGDHANTQLLLTSEAELLKKISTPFMIFLPDDLRPDYEIDQGRFGSHKDVFPTLFNISLSDAEYINSGNNLMTPASDSTYFFGVYRYNTGFSSDGCVLVNDNLFLRWESGNNYLLTPSGKTDALSHLELKTRAYSASMSCFIKNELLSKSR